MSLRSMARASGHAPSTIHRIWRAFGLQPHRCKLSSDLVEKVRDVCIWRRDRALVLCVDEKSPWTVPSPSCRCAPGRRSGAATTTSATARSLRGSTSPRERSSANVSRAIGPESSANSSTSSRRTSLLISIHIVMDNYGTHDQGDPRLVRQTAALAGPFHTHQRLLAQPGRALVRAADRQTDAPPRSWRSSTTSTRHLRATSSPPSSGSASNNRNRSSRRCELRNPLGPVEIHREFMIPEHT